MARKVVATALQAKPATPRFLREAAKLERKLGELEAAVKYCEAAARLDPRSYKTWLLVSGNCAQLRCVDEASLSCTEG